MRSFETSNRTHWKPLKIFALVLCSAILTATLFLFCTSPCHAAGFENMDFTKAGKFITALERDERGRVWIGTEDNGVLVCDRNHFAIKYFATNRADAGGADTFAPNSLWQNHCTAK